VGGFWSGKRSLWRRVMPDTNIVNVDPAKYLTELLPIYRDVIYDPTDAHIQDELQQYDSTSKVLFGYRKDTMLAGIIGIEKHDEYIEVLHFGVHPDCRGHGDGTRLMDFVKGLGYTIRLETDDDAIVFYRKYGFSDASFSDPLHPGITRYQCEYKLVQGERV
jgi:ribosomal protein S18 acetylase RimI-like enzyme